MVCVRNLYNLLKLMNKLSRAAVNGTGWCDFFGYSCVFFGLRICKQNRDFRSPIRGYGLSAGPKDV
jgi:hypothetical protein